MNTIHTIIISIALVCVVYYGYTEIKKINHRLDYLSLSAQQNSNMCSMPIRQNISTSPAKQPLPVYKPNPLPQQNFNQCEDNEDTQEDTQEDTEQESEVDSQQETDSNSQYSEDTPQPIEKQHTTDTDEIDSHAQLNLNPTILQSNNIFSNNSPNNNKIYNTTPSETDPIIMNYLQSALPSASSPKANMVSSIDKYEIIEDVATQSHKPTISELQAKTIRHLKDILKDLNLSTVGTKSVLIDRILSNL